MCIGIWITTVVSGVHSIFYAVECRKDAIYFQQRKYLFIKALLLIITSGAYIGMSVLAISDGIRLGHIISPSVVAGISMLSHYLWNPKPPPEKDYLIYIDYQVANDYKEQALKHVLGILGNFKKNSKESPYRNSDEALDAAIEHFKVELENVRKSLFDKSQLFSNLRH